MYYEIIMFAFMLMGSVVGILFVIYFINSNSNETVNTTNKKKKKKKDKSNILKQRTSKEKSVVDVMCETYNIDEKELLDEQRKLVDKDFEYLNTK